MENRKFGYIRVSSKDQNEGRQLEVMKEAGIHERDLFIDKQSGKDFQREQYQLLKRMMRPGDILYIHSLDRFGRNKEEILQEWNDITKTIKADIVVLDMPLLDTTQFKDSLGTFIADLVLQILSWMAQEKRERIRKRQREGIDLALDSGVKFGRPTVKLTNEFMEAYTQWKAGDITAVAAMRQAGVKKTTFYKLVKEYEKEKAASQS
jgi:DNA invertase Pin-like site-specific DNA recombinase